LPKNRAEMSIVGTRWHYDDIYERIKKRDDQGSRGHRYKIVIAPVVDKHGNPVFPARFPAQAIENLKIEQGSFVFGSQYLLDPVPDDQRTFDRKNIRYTRPDDIKSPVCGSTLGLI